MKLDEIEHLTRLNADNINNRSNPQLNEATWDNQLLSLEEGIARIQQQFRRANEAARGQLLMDMNRHEATLEREQQKLIKIQDPPEMRKPRGHTFGQGGRRRPTGAEIAEKELEQYDRAVTRRRVESAIPTNINTESQVADVIIVEPWPVEKTRTCPSMSQLRPIEHPDRLIHVANSQVSNSSPNRPICEIKRPFMYEGKLTQSRKRVRKELSFQD
jgi:hypothetical protein